MHSVAISEFRKRIGRTILLLMASATLGTTDRVDAQTAADKLPADHAERMAQGLTQFRDDVAGLLKRHCLKCHGGDKTRGQLDLATREGLLQGGENGPAVVPFQRDESLLFKLITHREEPAMPDGQPKLPDAAIAKLGTWIHNGAPYDKPLIEGRKPARNGAVVTDEDRQWWAFQSLQRVTPPNVDGVSHVVDRFLTAQAATHGLTLPPAADKPTLIRRAALDLVGIPPTPEDITAFVTNDAPDAWPRLLDQLLDRPGYGERWARHWLDVARFAESAGFEHDYDRPGAWAYRDFVIKALNADMPFDQFAHWQLAGDEYAPDNALALSATGFLGAGVFPTQITANEVERTRYDALDDMLSTTCSAFLGLTVGCARCHDHKFDPIPTRDYYRMLSTFTTTVRSNVDVDLDPEQSRQRRQQWEAEHAPLVAAWQQHEAGLQPKFREWLTAGAAVNDQPTWALLDAEWKSQAGATLKRLEDGSVLAEGANPPHDAYTATATTTLRRLTGLRLEALAHPSLKQGGPGRAPNGNFGLSTIAVMVSPKSGGPARTVVLTKPMATFEQNNSSLSIAASLDDNPSTGWAVDPQFGKDHAAVFTFSEPIDIADGAQFQVTLDFRVNGQHHIGRPRLSVIADVAPRLQADTIPAAVADLLPRVRSSGGGETLNDDQRRTLFDWWKRRDSDWRTQQTKLDEHLAGQPKTTTTILICGEGYKPMRHHTQGADFFTETHVLDRGSTDRKREVATPSFLQVLMRSADQERRWSYQPPAEAKFSGRRRALAEWLTDVDDGAGALTARVIVNRLWQHHFGVGIVATANDFGKTGAPPSHPELLDWLAGELIRNGWRLKPLHTLLMTSAAYQQSAAPPQTSASDAGVALFVRRLPQRLEGEALRDAILAVSGRLDPTMYGPGTKDERSVRRSIYFTMKRSQLIGSMVVFDQPEPLVSQGGRPTTTVAPQALLLMNGPQVREWAEAFARGAQAASGADAAAAIDWTYRRALGRNPTATERDDAVRFLNVQQATYAAESRTDAAAMALADLCQVILALNEFAYVN